MSKSADVRLVSRSTPCTFCFSDNICQSIRWQCDWTNEKKNYDLSSSKIKIPQHLSVYVTTESLEEIIVWEVEQQLLPPCWYVSVWRLSEVTNKNLILEIFFEVHYFLRAFMT